MIHNMKDTIIYKNDFDKHMNCMDFLPLCESLYAECNDRFTKLAPSPSSLPEQPAISKTARQKFDE